MFLSVHNYSSNVFVAYGLIVFMPNKMQYHFKYVTQIWIISKCKMTVLFFSLEDLYDLM